MRIGILASTLCLALAVVVWGEGTVSEVRATGSVKSSGGPAKMISKGRIENVDLDKGILVVRMRGGAANFDLSTPVLIGYHSVSEIGVGDVVDIRYVENGIRIARIEKGRRPSIEVRPLAKPAEKPKPLPSVEPRTPPQPLPPAASPRKLQRRHSETNHDTFEYADANKDGRLSPVELTTVIKDLTMEEFRRYDKNRNNSVDRSEFLEAVKDRKDRNY